MISLDKLITSAISLTLIRRSSSTIWWTYSLVVVLFNFPQRMLVQSRLTSATETFTDVNDGTESLSTDLISVDILLFKNKYLFMKILITTCQTTTDHAKWLKLQWVFFIFRSETIQYLLWQKYLSKSNKMIPNYNYIIHSHN